MLFFSLFVCFWFVLGLFCFVFSGARDKQALKYLGGFF